MYCVWEDDDCRAGEGRSFARSSLVLSKNVVALGNGMVGAGIERRKGRMADGRQEKTFELKTIPSDCVLRIIGERENVELKLF